MPRNLPKYVRSKTAKGKMYLYFDLGTVNEKGKPVLKALPPARDPNFSRLVAMYEAARKNRAAIPSAMTVSAMADLYEKSQEFRRLAPNSQAGYRIYLQEIRKRFHKAPAFDVMPKDVRGVRDQMADRPGAANMLIRTLGALYKWGRTHEYVTTNPVKDVDLFDGGEHEPWPDWLVEAALAEPEVRLPVAMLYYTAQRIGDVCRMRWTDIRGGAIHLRQEKTGLSLTVPIHRRLAELLDAEPRNGFVILPMSPETLRKRLQRWASGKGAKVVPHGLRKNAVNALLEAGCSSAETAAISGQTLQVIELYARRRDTTVLGAAAILKWEKR